MEKVDHGIFVQKTRDNIVYIKIPFQFLTLPIVLEKKTMCFICVACRINGEYVAPMSMDFNL